MKKMETITLKELKDNPQKVINDILILGKKKQILINGKTEIEILLTQDIIKAESKLKELEKENEALKFILGVKQGLQDYNEGNIVDHEVVREKFERYLTNEVENKVDR